MPGVTSARGSGIHHDKKNNNSETDIGIGYCMNGSNTGFCALAAGSYPTEMRATGTSWMLGVGRFGGIAGAMLGAAMLHANWSFGQVFAALAVPAAVGGAAVLLKGARHRGTFVPVSVSAGH